MQKNERLEWVDGGGLEVGGGRYYVCTVMFNSLTVSGPGRDSCRLCRRRRVSCRPV